MYPLSEHGLNTEEWKKKMEDFLRTLHLDKTTVNDVFRREHISSLL